METEAPDPADRFAALHAESMELLTAAQSLVGEMKGLLEDCKRRRPVLDQPANTGKATNTPPLTRSHRGARVGKARRTGVRRRPR